MKVVSALERGSSEQSRAKRGFSREFSPQSHFSILFPHSARGSRAFARRANAKFADCVSVYHQKGNLINISLMKVDMRKGSNMLGKNSLKNIACYFSQKNLSWSFFYPHFRDEPKCKIQYKQNLWCQNLTQFNSNNFVKFQARKQNFISARISSCN